MERYLVSISRPDGKLASGRNRQKYIGKTENIQTRLRSTSHMWPRPGLAPFGPEWFHSRCRFTGGKADFVIAPPEVCP